MFRRVLMVILVALLCRIPAESAALAKGKCVIEAFGYRGVTIDGGSLRRQMDEVRDYYLRIPNDDLLKGFRARAGRPSPGVDLGGWYTSDRFHIFGQIVSGLSRMYAATGDAACKEKADTLIAEWSKCIEPDGYFFYSRTPNAPHYTFDKMVGGLVDAHLYCGNRDGLRHLSKITDWAAKNLDRAGAASGKPDHAEWYTLSENLFRAYVVTGDVKYKSFARVWEYRSYWNAYATRGSIFALRPAFHAYSHVNTLCGAAMAYVVTGDKPYLDAARHGHDYLASHQRFATGGYGPNEQLVPVENLPARLMHSTNTFETQCGSWAVFKLCKYLMSFTGDARYGDWIELLAINGIGASIPSSPDGSVFYYANYNMGGASKQNIHPWACCAGTRPQAVADYCDLIYFRDAGGIYVNLFTPSTVNWTQKGAPVTLQQRTRFPEDDRMEFTVRASVPVEFAIKVRVPAWLNGRVLALVNGKSIEPSVNTLGWATFKRRWKGGDRLTVRLPMKLRAEPLPHSDKASPAAIVKGPVVLAVRQTEPQRNPATLIDFLGLEKSLVPSPGEPLTYHLAKDPSVLVRPFYAYEQGEDYIVYLDPDRLYATLGHGQLRYGTGWRDVGGLHITTRIGAEMTHTFEGDWVRWVGCKFDDAGKAEVSIDGKAVDVVDQYAPGRDVPFRWERTGLGPGKHTIAIKLLEEKNPRSKDRYINIARLEVP